MTTRTEERLKMLFDERLNITLQEISRNVYSIFLWGVVVGIVVSYTNMLSLCAGFSIGYVLAKKQIPLVEFALMKSFVLFDSTGIISIIQDKIKIE